MQEKEYSYPKLSISTCKPSSQAKNFVLSMPFNKKKILPVMFDKRS
jgi:hypothetical protein